ncbi:hypothetical protein GGP41_001340 [Bipolaris sorokiniana]|uniref:Myb-like domain-containing protein n=2 Tax=Cochliobolus sativus TaxID=45130 RepID=A0A8H5ZAS4_COCSA|nr:uncharacterized protein COCSADRAFT_210723 [Bipolaris sorokiniana ND90Pr]EMD69503.1 hypothetical protein COCSADRAFT_210723 [Bipolaris sorokiniana ND90Pr]KAF5845199.1 hypothetical protein GGP41_001340 [Bipolaris sorokiniana]
MSITLECAIPPPHLFQSRPSSWQSPYHSHTYPASTSSPAPMSPQSLQPSMSHLPESPLPSHEAIHVPASAWYGPSISAPECSSETSYASYNNYITPHTSSINLSPPATAFPYMPKHPGSATQLDPSVTLSPGTVYSRDSVVPEPASPSEEPQSDPRCSLHQSALRLGPQSHLLDRNHSSLSNLNTARANVSWAMNPLGIHSSHESYYPAFPSLNHSPRLSEPSVDLSNQMISPQPRRTYTPIAPLPQETPRSHSTKRYHEDEEEALDSSKRRKRSDSQTSTQFELSEEDKLLLKLKEQDSMPWKDIAARFQTELQKSYQIPALQMRYKRLRERMRVWTDTDRKALRMAHEYWLQNKFEIIAQKMLEFGAQEKWTARQCSRQWQMMDHPPLSYAQFDHHLQQGFAPYAMSPIEPPPNNSLPFLHT